MRARSKILALAAFLVTIASWTSSGQGLPVTYKRLLKADQEPGNWLMYSNTYDGWRFSRLDQITTDNVRDLRVKWIFQGRHNHKFETTPLVVDGILYLTRPENAIYALDGQTGKQLWLYEHRNPDRTFTCCGKVNRGLAILGTTLFMNTLDMHVVAVDAKTGLEVWKTKMFDHTAAAGYAATGAPLIVKDKLIVGMAGGERAVSGFLDAYDPKTGKRLWRFNTIPQPGEPNFGTWAANSWKTGGASTWNTGSYDPETNTLFWGIGNPWPPYDDASRAGDNLYSASVVALNPDNGKLRWHYQFTPHDTHDWDAAQNPILVDIDFRGQQRKVLAWPNRNGFFYLIDRTNGEFLSATAFVKQTWNAGFDYERNGRPKRVPGMEPTIDGNDRVWPGIDGGSNWMPHSYSPLTKLLYVFAREERRVYRITEVPPVTTEENARNPIRFNWRTVLFWGACLILLNILLVVYMRSRGFGLLEAIFIVLILGNAGWLAMELSLGHHDFLSLTQLLSSPARLYPSRAQLLGATRPRFAPEESWGKAIAIDPSTGAIKWEYRVVSPPWGGLMSTAGGLVFGGTIEGTIFALNAATGTPLWTFSSNGPVHGTAISYVAGGKQLVSIPAGDIIVTFGLD